MGVAASSAEIPQTNFCNKNTMVIERKSLQESNSKLSLNCEDQMSFSSTVLPGQVEEIKTVAHDMAYSCVYIDEISSIASQIASTLSTDGGISIRTMIGPEVRTAEPVGFGNSDRSSESLMETKKKRYPALASYEKPKKVKKAMLESLLIAVPSLKYVYNGRNRRSKPRVCRNPVQIRDLDMENEEALGEFVVNELYSVSIRELDKDQSCDSFSTVDLFDKGVLGRQKLLSRVDKYPDEN